MNSVLIIILSLLSINVLYYLIFTLGAHFKQGGKVAVTSKQVKMTVLIPAYKEDAIIVDTAVKALQQDYPKEDYDVIVIADSLKKETLQILKGLPLTTIEVSFDKSTKAKALNSAMAQIDVRYDVAVVLDADNVMAKDFLNKIKSAMAMGAQAVQGHRVAKNSDGKMALLDAVSEEINNTIFREGHVRLGLASALIGSGMAFDYQLFKNKMKEIEAIGGFDKELELLLLKEGNQIEYLKDAIVYDEKVSNVAVFEKQRTRWLAAQFRYAFKSFPNALWHLLSKGNINYFDKSFQFFLLPRVVLLGVVTLALLAVPFIPSMLAAGFSILFIVYALTLALAIPRRLYNLELFRAVTQVPLVLIKMITAMTKFQKAKSNFLHTPHQL